MINNKLLNIETMKKLFLFFYLSVVSIAAFAAEQFVIFTPAGNHFPLVANGVPLSDIHRFFRRQRGNDCCRQSSTRHTASMRKKPELLTSTSSKRCIIAGTYGTPFYKEADVSRQNRQKRNWMEKMKNTSCKSSPILARE